MVLVESLLPALTLVIVPSEKVSEKGSLLIKSYYKSLILSNCSNFSEEIFGGHPRCIFLFGRQLHENPYHQLTHKEQLE